MNCRRNCASLNELRSPLRAALSFLAKLFPRHKPTECSWTCTRPDLQEGISWHQNIEYNLAWLKNYKPVEKMFVSKNVFFVFISRLEVERVPWLEYLQFVSWCSLIVFNCNKRLEISIFIHFCEYFRPQGRLKHWQKSTKTINKIDD